MEIYSCKYLTRDEYEDIPFRIKINYRSKLTSPNIINFMFICEENELNKLIHEITSNINLIPTDKIDNNNLLIDNDFIINYNKNVHIKFYINEYPLPNRSFIFIDDQLINNFNIQNLSYSEIDIMRKILIKNGTYLYHNRFDSNIIQLEDIYNLIIYSDHSSDNNDITIKNSKIQTINIFNNLYISSYLNNSNIYICDSIIELIKIDENKMELMNVKNGVIKFLTNNYQSQFQTIITYLHDEDVLKTNTIIDISSLIVENVIINNHNISVKLPYHKCNIIDIKSCNRIMVDKLFNCNYLFILSKGLSSIDTRQFLNVNIEIIIFGNSNKLKQIDIGFLKNINIKFKMYLMNNDISNITVYGSDSIFEINEILRRELLDVNSNRYFDISNNNIKYKYLINYRYNLSNINISNDSDIVLNDNYSDKLFTCNRKIINSIQINTNLRILKFSTTTRINIIELNNNVDDFIIGNKCNINTIIMNNVSIEYFHLYIGGKIDTLKGSARINDIRINEQINKFELILNVLDIRSLKYYGKRIGNCNINNIDESILIYMINNSAMNKLFLENITLKTNIPINLSQINYIEFNNVYIDNVILNDDNNNKFENVIFGNCEIVTKELPILNNIDCNINWFNEYYHPSISIDYENKISHKHIISSNGYIIDNIFECTCNI